MTRDRPASGAQDSTLEGEFPSDLGSNGGGGGGDSSRSLPISRSTLSEPYLGLKEGAFNPRDNISPFEFPANFGTDGNILAINNTPIGGSLSGVYRFGTQNGLFNNGYNTVTQFTTITSSFTEQTIPLGSVSVTGANPALFYARVSAFTQGSPITRLTKMTLSINNLSADFFNTYYRLSGAGFGSTTNISYTTTTFGFMAPPIPYYQYSYLLGSEIDYPNDNGRQARPFIPNSDTTFDLTMNITAFGTTWSAQISAFIYEFQEPTPTATITTSL